jgi:hypothetical protein
VSASVGPYHETPPHFHSRRPFCSVFYLETGLRKLLAKELCECLQHIDVAHAKGLLADSRFKLRFDKEEIFPIPML